MKLSFRAFSLMLAIVLAGNLFLTSCKDENNDPAKTSKPLLATMSSYSKDGTLHELESYRYDTNGRLVEMNTDDDYKVVLEYSSATVTLKEYDGEELSYSSIFNLDAKGYVVSSESEEGPTTYTFDDNGYRKTIVDNNENSTYTQTFTVANGNYVTVLTEIKRTTPLSALPKKSGSFEKPLFLESLGKNRQMQNTLKSASDQINIERTDFQFYTDKANTIDTENMGIKFMGKQNLNPIKQETEISEDWPDRTNIYHYEYDTRGRITKKIWEHGGYNVYTYVD